MRGMVITLFLLSSVLMISACTQQAVTVVNKSSEFYGRSGMSMSASASQGYSSTASRDIIYTAPTVSSAPTSSIGVSELPPPDAKYAPKSKPQEHSAVSQPTERVLASRDVLTAPRKAEHSSKFIWPVEGKVVSGFGPTGAGKANDGIRIAAKENEPVYAAAGGEVVFVGAMLKSYGNMVIIKHKDKFSTTYAHLSRANVDKYDRVKQGDVIGFVGETGKVKKPQLLFSVREGQKPVDPETYLPTQVAAG